MINQTRHSQTVRTLLGANRIVPVVRIDDAARAPELVKALKRGGITVIEITFRTDAAEEAFRRCRAAEPSVVVGAGTVRTVEQADRAVAVGAQFMVAPGLSPAIIERARALGVPHVPGAITPTEVEQAVSHGLGTLKFFPAEQAGGDGVPVGAAVGVPRGVVYAHRWDHAGIRRRLSEAAQRRGMRRELDGEAGLDCGR